MAFYVPNGCIRFARYCGKIYSRHLFPYGGLVRILWKRLQADLKNILWKTVNGVITQFMLFEEYTTEKRSTVLSTSSERTLNKISF